ncbi:MAG: hypothetical protein ACTSVI_12160 [Promethearchaeota archaeon]
MKKIIFFHVVSFPMFLACMFILGMVFHRFDDFSAALSTSLVFQGISYSASAFTILYILFRLFLTYHERKTNLSLILIDYFISSFTTSMLQSFLSFLTFSDINLQLQWETMTITSLISMNFAFWIFFFELFQSGENGARFALKSRLLILGYLGGASLTVIQGLFGNVTHLFLMLITLPLIVSNMYVSFVVGYKGLFLSKQNVNPKEKKGFFFIGLSAIFIGTITILAFIDYVVLNQSVFIGTLVGFLYLVSSVFLYFGIISPMKSPKDNQGK